MKWKEAIERAKRYRSAPPKSVFDVTRVLLRSKSKSLKIQQALDMQEIVFSARLKIIKWPSQRETNRGESMTELNALASVKNRK